MYRPRNTKRSSLHTETSPGISARLRRRPKTNAIVNDDNHNGIINSPRWYLIERRVLIRIRPAETTGHLFGLWLRACAPGYKGSTWKYVCALCICMHNYWEEGASTFPRRPLLATPTTPVDNLHSNVNMYFYFITPYYGLRAPFHRFHSVSTISHVFFPFFSFSPAFPFLYSKYLRFLNLSLSLSWLRS